MPELRSKVSELAACLLACSALCLHQLLPGAQLLAMDIAMLESPFPATG